MADLFAQEIDSQDRDAALNRPLADRMRPNSLDGFFGQEHLLGTGKPLRQAIEQGRTHSMIF
jgi:putative ATPase